MDGQLEAAWGAACAPSLLRPGPWHCQRSSLAPAHTELSLSACRPQRQAAQSAPGSAGGGPRRPGPAAAGPGAGAILRPAARPAHAAARAAPACARPAGRPAWACPNFCGIRSSRRPPFRHPARLAAQPARPCSRLAPRARHPSAQARPRPGRGRSGDALQRDRRVSSALALDHPHRRVQAHARPPPDRVLSAWLPRPCRHGRQASGGAVPG